VSATVMTFIGVASLVGGLVAFSKRDLTGD
jgi:hypothetical protein